MPPGVITAVQKSALDQSSERMLTMPTVRENPNEVERYYPDWYLGLGEAVWRIIEFRTCEESPPVMSLPIHLRGEQCVYFLADVSLEQLETRTEQARCKLMGFYHLSQVYEKKI